MTLVISLLLAQSVQSGISQFQRGEYSQALATLSAVPESPIRNAFLGLSRAAMGNCKEAEGLLAQRYELADLRRITTLALAQCKTNSGELNEAQALLAKLETEFPDNPDVLYLAARLHMRAFNDTVDRMFERAPASYRVNQLSGEILEMQGRSADAANEYRKAIEKNPTALNLHYRLGRALLMESQLDDARAEFEAELKLNPNDALAEYQVAQILQVRQKPDEAALRFEHALTLRPDFVEAMIALAKLKPTRSVELLEKSVALQPKNEAARYGLMVAYRNAGRSADAAKQKEELDKLQKRPEGEFSEFLKRLGEKPKP